jgi:hypothetical protein
MVLTSCGPSEEEEIVGQWKMVDFESDGEKLNAILLDRTFNADGKYTTLDGEDVVDSGVWHFRNDSLVITSDGNVYPKSASYSITIDDGILRLSNENFVFEYQKAF